MKKFSLDRVLVLGTTLFVALSNVAMAGDIAQPTRVPEPSLFSLIAIAGAAIYLINKRKK